MLTIRPQTHSASDRRVSAFVGNLGRLVFVALPLFALDFLFFLGSPGDVRSLELWASTCLLFLVPTLVGGVIQQAVLGVLWQIRPLRHRATVVASAAIVPLGMLILVPGLAQPFEATRFRIIAVASLIAFAFAQRMPDDDQARSAS